MEYWQAIREVITSLVSVVGVVIAVKGYSAWQRQILGKTEHDAARNVLFSALRVREAVHDTRLPRSITWVGQTNDPDSVESRVFNHSKERYQEKLRVLQGRVSELQLAGLEAEALWGEGANAELLPLLNSASRLDWNIQIYLLSSGDSPTFETLFRSPDRIQSMLGTISYISPLREEDPFSSQVESQFALIADYYQPKLQLTRR